MTSAEKAFCEGWVKAHARTWQVLNRSEWKYQFHPKTLVRYVEEVRQTEQEIQLLLEYLASADCVATLSLYDQSVSATWKPTRAWLELSNKSVQGVRSVRLYHGLMTDADQSADGPYVIEDGCAYAVSITYYWNKNNPPSVPSGTSGVSYQISGLQRDAETGLYTYAIERRERVQQDIPEYLTATTAFEDAKEEAHFGVKHESVETTGKQASVGDGKIVQRKVSKNSDCTSDIHNTTTEERQVSGASETVRVGLSGTVRETTNANMPTKAEEPSSSEIGKSVSNELTRGGRWTQRIRSIVLGARTVIGASKKETVFSGHTGDTVVQSDEYEPHSSAENGLLVSESVSRTEDGAYRIEKSTTEEKAVADAGETIHVGLNGKTVTTVSRNMAEKADGSELGIGESVENTKTDGGRWNQVVRRVTNYFLHIGDSCRKSVFAHTQSATDIQGTDPGFDHVDDAGGGIVQEKIVSRTENGGYRIESRTTTETPVADAAESVHVGLSGTTKTVTHRNQSEKAATEGLDVGESVENSKTDGGLWNQTIRSIVREASVWLGETCRKTLFSHSHGKRIVQGTDPGFDHVSDASGGVIVEKNVSRTADGSYEVSEQTTTETPVVDATVSKRMTLSGLVVRKESKNQTSPISDPTEVGDSVSNTKTPGGLYDTMQEQAGRVGAGKIRESHSETAFNRFDHDVENVSASDAAGIDVDSATLQADGTIERKSKHKNENGTSDVATETVRPVERSREFSWSDSYKTYTKFRYWNFKEPQKPTFSGSDTKVSCEFGMNAHGLYDGSWEMAYNGGGGESIHQWSSTWDEKYVINVIEVDGRKKFFGQKYRVAKRIKRNSNESGIDVAISDIQEAEGSWSSFCGTKPAKYESRMLNWSRCIWVVYDFQDISGGLTSWMES